MSDGLEIGCGQDAGRGRKQLVIFNRDVRSVEHLESVEMLPQFPDGASLKLIVAQPFPTEFVDGVMMRIGLVVVTLEPSNDVQCRLRVRVFRY